MRVDSGPDLPDAAGVRARLLHSCVVVVPSRRDFTFSTAKFGLSTSWNVFIAAGPPVSSPSSPNVDPRVRIPIPAFPPRRGSLPSLLLDHDTQATWAPRPISIRFSTSDSRLSTSVIPFLENQHPFSTEFDTIDPIDSPTTGVFAFSTQKKPPNLCPGSSGGHRAARPVHCRSRAASRRLRHSPESSSPFGVLTSHRRCAWKGRIHRARVPCRKDRRHVFRKPQQGG